MTLGVISFRCFMMEFLDGTTQFFIDSHVRLLRYWSNVVQISTLEGLICSYKTKARRVASFLMMTKMSHNQLGWYLEVGKVALL